MRRHLSFILTTWMDTRLEIVPYFCATVSMEPLNESLAIYSEPGRFRHRVRLRSSPDFPREICQRHSVLGTVRSRSFDVDFSRTVALERAGTHCNRWRV